MKNTGFEEDSFYYSGEYRLGGKCTQAIKHALAKSNAVGVVIGTYDENLSIIYVSEILLRNLGYDYQSFMKATKGSFRNMFYGENITFLEEERFSVLHGVGEGEVLICDQTPVPVRMCKEDSLDEDGNPIWIVTMQMNWLKVNLKLINRVLESGMWYFDCDSKGKIKNVFWSHDFRSMLGYHDILDFPNQLHSWINRIHPDDKKRTVTLLRDMMADKTGESKFDVEYRMKMQNGVYEWFRSSADANRRLNGTVRRVTGTFININEQKMAERQLRKSDVFHHIYSKTNICEFFVDLKDNQYETLKVIDELNGIIRKSGNWDDLAQDLINGFVEKKYHSVISLIMNRDYIMERLNEDKHEISQECQIKIGSQIYWVRNEIVAFTQEKDCRYVVVLVRDITESKMEAERFKELTDKNAVLDELLKGTVRLVDHFSISDLNKDHYQVYHISSDVTPHKMEGSYQDFLKTLGKRFRLMDLDYDIEEFFSAKHLKQMLVNPDDLLRFEYCTLDESVIKHMSILPVSFADGQVERVMCIAQNITEEKKQEKQSRQVLKEACDAANRASHAKTEFLSNMSHDIRTPMNAIIGMTAIAGSNIQNTERVADCLEKITRASRHLLGLINEVLDMSRIESGKLTLSEEAFHLPALVDNMALMMENEMKQHHHSFELKAGPMVHENVWGDSLRIQQIITNVLGNAIKYTPDGGHIIFSISEKEEKSNHIGCYEFIIEDNGIGMSEEFQKVMFEPFVRADDKRVGEIQGTGLGMTIARNIVQMMNGDIRVESELGKGSRFIITVFLRLQNEEIENFEELKGLDVLVVDDEEESTESTVVLLKEIGMNGYAVSSGEAAIAFAKERIEKKQSLFAVLIDWKMPGMNGIETTRELRELLGRDVMIVVLTAYDYFDIEEEAREAGVDVFLTKPLFKSRLITTMKNEYDGTAQIKPKDYLKKIEQCDFHGKRILLVEDIALNREIARVIIEMTGALIEEAVNGQEGYRMVEKNPPGYYDLVFMDIQMPVMNGYEAAKAIRSMEDPLKSSVPIIAMTANAFTEDEQLAKNAGMNGHLSKPLDMDKLNKVLVKWLSE